MSAQNTHVLSAVPQSELFELKPHHFVLWRYIVNRLSSCWHLRLTRPITHGSETYRACIRCGMHRKFDLADWKSIGRFYSPFVERRSGH
jgi:hypothetical protein